jgi:ArsR family transcriptional regulator
MLELFKILADETRLRLLRILRQGDFTVQDLMQILAMGQSRISRHLLLMSDAGLLKVEKQGTWRYYRLASENELFDDIWPAIEKQLSALAGHIEDSAAISSVMADRRKRSQDFFDRHACEWDSLHVELLNLPDYQDTLMAMLPAGGLVVEVGVGSGSLLPMIASKAARTIGLDQSPAMVALARETIARHHLTDRVDVRLGEMNYLPFADSSAHAVVMNQVLHHAEQPGEVLKEVHRILTADGILIIADLTRHEHDWARERLADQWLGFSPEELENWLADTDMKVVSYQEYGDEKNQQSVFLLAAGSS